MGLIKEVGTRNSGSVPGMCSGLDAASENRASGAMIKVSGWLTALKLWNCTAGSLCEGCFVKGAGCDAQSVLSAVLYVVPSGALGIPKQELLCFVSGLDTNVESQATCD